jgi:hypothetical protein
MTLVSPVLYRCGAGKRLILHRTARHGIKSHFVSINQINLGLHWSIKITKFQSFHVAVSYHGFGIRRF